MFGKSEFRLRGHGEIAIDLMARFKAARKEDLDELLRTPTIKALIGKYRNRIDEQIESLAVE